LCVLALVFGSCTTAYKTGQTPDDVYYSPARPQDEYVRTERRQEQYRPDEEAEDDRYLRMKVRNRRMWSDLDYYYSDPYAFHYYNRFNTFNNIYFNTPWNHYSSWNYFYNPYNRFNYYNPYGPHVIVANPRTQNYSRPRFYNLNVYNTPGQNTYNPKTSTGPRRVFQNSNNDSYNSGTLRNVFRNNNSNTSTQPSMPTRSGSGSGSSGSGTKSSNAPVRRF
jgi:hypothetical protein